VKALHVMLFLLLFNLSVSIVGGLHIYNMGVDPGEFTKGNIETYQTASARQDVFANFFITALESLIVGIISGSIVSYFTRIPADKAYVYSIFFSTYFWMGWNSTSIIWSVGSGNQGVQMIVIIFSIILIILFMIAIMQMPVGGWKSYE